jgi:DNA-directed RNA polymerase specialized sigma24 family protein
MPGDSKGSITEIFDQLRAGDTKSAKQLWDRFFPRLHAVANKVLAGRELPLGAEDAVQQAFFNFFRRVERGQLVGDVHRDGLWKLLSITTAQIANKQRRNEMAGKRGNGRVHLASEIDGYDRQPLNLDELIGFVPAPECDLICEELLIRLDDDVREIAVLRLAGYTNSEIKEIVGQPLRSIERRLQLIRSIWSAYALKS